MYMYAYLYPTLCLGSCSVLSAKLPLNRTQLESVFLLATFLWHHHCPGIVDALSSFAVIPLPWGSGAALSISWLWCWRLPICRACKDLLCACCGWPIYASPAIAVRMVHCTWSTFASVLFHFSRVVFICSLGRPLRACLYRHWLGIGRHLGEGH